MLESGETCHIAATNSSLQNFPLSAPLECAANTPRPKPGPVNIPVVTAWLRAVGSVCVCLLLKLAEDGNTAQWDYVGEAVGMEPHRRTDLNCSWSLSQHSFKCSTLLLRKSRSSHDPGVLEAVWHFFFSQIILV